MSYSISVKLEQYSTNLDILYIYYTFLYKIVIVMDHDLAQHYRY